MRNTILWLTTIILFSGASYGQSDVDYFVVGADTTFCTKLYFRQFSERHLKEIRY
ncbi:MAG: hypothetical protein U0176_00370 [Bacteroidia bacterium]